MLAIIGAPHDEFLKVLKTFLDRKDNLISGVVLTIPGETPEFVNDRGVINSVFSAPNPPENMIFAVEMNSKRNSFFLGLFDDEVRFGCMQFDLNGKPIHRGSIDNMACVKRMPNFFFTDIIGALDISESKQFGFYFENEEKEDKEVFRGSWVDIKSRILECYVG